ncbi:MAG: hypothetical protein K8S18_08220 [Desulfobacula sp.]|nr:hypothetical protein [Desulfobacula sp.]
MKNKIDFKELLSDKQELNKIFNHIGQEQYEIGEILSTYEKDGNRQGIVLLVQDNKIDELQKIIIDAIYGEPNSTQVKDVTYDYGADCDKSIILYTLGYSDLNVRSYEYDGEMSEGFIKINNDCGCDTYLINVSKTLDKSKEPVYRYKTDIKPGNKRLTSLKKLPTKQEFEQAEFGIFYNYSSDWRNPHHIEHPENWFDNYWHLIFQDISFRYPVWTGDGLFMQGVSKSEIGDITLKWLMDSKIELLKKFFDNREIVIDIPPSGRNVMEIKLWDKPISYFAKASSKNKERIAEIIRGYDSVSFEFLDNLFERRMSDEEILKDLGPIPEDAFNELEKEISA